MMKVLTIILAGGRGERLGPLTRDRTKPAVPFGGVYRIIDFTLSNCINSGLRQVYLLTQYKSDSLARHLQTGWGFLPAPLGEFIEMIPAQQRLGDRWYRGTADAVFQNQHLVENHRPDLVLILAGDHIYKMDYSHLIRFHQKKDAEATVATIEEETVKSTGFGVMELNDDSRVVGFQEKPPRPKELPGRPGWCAASMGIYVFNTEVLLERLRRDAREESQHDFGRNIVPGMIDERRVFGFEFKDRNKKAVRYWRDVGTVDTYWEANMDLVSVSPQLNLYDQGWPVFNSRPPYPPPKFVFAQERKGGRVGTALDSLVGAGSIISGGRVQNSVLGQNVRVNSYARVQESILFNDVDIGRHARIKRAIIDMGVKVPPREKIGYDLERDRKRFYVSPEGVVVIAKKQKLQGRKR